MIYPIPGLPQLVSYLSNKQQEELQTLVPNFPNILKQAKIDFAKFQAGEHYFNSNQHDEVQEWFMRFPDLWRGIRPNFEFTATGLVSPHQQEIIADADKFVRHIQTTLTTYQPQNIGLGIATIVVAGIIVAATFGIGGIIWAIGYVKEQENISYMISEVTAGRLSESVLKAAIEKADNNPFDNVTDIIKYGLLAAGIFLAWPLLSKLGSGK